MPKELRAEVDAIKQLKLPVQHWEKSDFDLYKTIIKMRTGVDKVAEAGLASPPERFDYGLAIHPKRKRKKKSLKIYFSGESAPVIYPGQSVPISAAKHKRGKKT